MVRTSDLRSRGRGFNSRPFQLRVTNLGNKLFTHMCLCHQVYLASSIILVKAAAGKLTANRKVMTGLRLLGDCGISWVDGRHSTECITHAFQSIAFIMFLHCVTLIFDLWPNINWLRKTNNGLSLCQVLWLVVQTNSQWDTYTQTDVAKRFTPATVVTKIAGVSDNGHNR